MKFSGYVLSWRRSALSEYFFCVMFYYLLFYFSHLQVKFKLENIKDIILRPSPPGGLYMIIEMV